MLENLIEGIQDKLLDFGYEHDDFSESLIPTSWSRLDTPIQTLEKCNQNGVTTLLVWNAIVGKLLVKIGEIGRRYEGEDEDSDI